MSVTVRFITYGSNSAFGNFGPGDVLRCGDAMAAHLVEQVKVARYDKVQAGESASVDSPSSAKTRAARKPQRNA